MFAFRSGGARGQARAAYIVAAVGLGVVLVIPALFGGRAEQVSVVFDHLAGPHGGEIRSQPVFDTDDLYDWTGRSSGRR